MFILPHLSIGRNKELKASVLLFVPLVGPKVYHKSRAWANAWCTKGVRCTLGFLFDAYVVGVMHTLGPFGSAEERLTWYMS